MRQSFIWNSGASLQLWNTAVTQGGAGSLHIPWELGHLKAVEGRPCGLAPGCGLGPGAWDLEQVPAEGFFFFFSLYSLFCFSFFLFLSFFFFSFFVFLHFLGPVPWHMEVPRLGVESEPQLPAYSKPQQHQN